MAKTKTSTKTKTSSKVASRKAKGSAAQPAGKGSMGEKEVTIDRRRGPRRQEEKDAAKPSVPPVKLERRAKVNRRRQIDPTTCERDYTDAEVEFMNALDEYKRKSGRMFPTCSEVLEVVRSLGYVQLTPSELAARSQNTTPQVEATAASTDEGFGTPSGW